MTIKIKLLAFTLLLVTVSIAVVATLGLYSILKIEGDIKMISTEALRHHSEELLVQFSSSVALRNDLIFSNVQNNASNTAAYVKTLFENPESFGRADWKFDEHVFKGPQGQYMNGKDDVSSLFIPNHVETNSELKRKIEQGTPLDEVFPTVLKNETNAVAIWMIGKDLETRYYPNIELGTILAPDQKLSDEIFYQVATPTFNPERKVMWTPVYDDPAGQGLMITASAPIYIDDEFFGVVGIDVTLNTIIKNIEEYNPTEGSYFFLIDDQGRAIALPEQAQLDMFGELRKPGEDLNKVSNAFSAVIHRMKDGKTESKEITVNGKGLYVAYTPLQGAGFSIGAVIEKDVAHQSIGEMQREMRSSVQRMILTIFLPSGIAILLLALALGVFLSRSISTPLIKLRDAVSLMGKGDMNVSIETGAKDEIGDLAKTFRQMTNDLKESQKSLEEHNKTLETKIQERTKDLEAINKETEQMNKMMVGRELKMMELKKELEDLKKKQSS